jgi:rhodanese-related sulfurtransferase
VVRRAAEVRDRQRALGEGTQVVVLCRRGNDSAIAAAQLRDNGLLSVLDLAGGLHAWADDVDDCMPKL